MTLLVLLSGGGVTGAVAQEATETSRTGSISAVSNGVSCDGRIATITFEGNRVTRAHVLKRELPQRIGARCRLEDLIAGQARLEDLGLFRTVRIELHPLPAPLPPTWHAGADAPPLAAALPWTGESDALPADENEAEAVDERMLAGLDLLELRYVVHEKFFFLGLPRLSRTSDGELRAGVSLEWTNFLGRLHEVKLTSEWRQEDDGQGRGGFVHSLDYDVPRFFGSNLGMSIGLGIADRQVGFRGRGEKSAFTIGEGQLQSYGAGLSLTQWLNDSDGVHGLRIFYGARVTLRDYALLEGERGESQDGLDLGWRIGLEQRSVHRDRYRRRGIRLGAALSFAHRDLGSDFSWNRVDGWLGWYHPLGSELDNLNAALSIGISDGAPFGDRFYAIGGGELMRGVEKGEREGDVRALLNLEYLRALRSRPAFRFVLFADMGNVWPIGNVDVGDVLIRTGVGARYKVEALSRRDLRIDLAWDPVRARVVPYLSTRLTF